MLKYGANNIGKIFLGSNEIGKAFLGSNLVFQKDGGGDQPEHDVGFIRNGAGAYINTGIIPNQDTRIVVKARGITPGAGLLFGARTAYSNNSFNLVAHDGYMTTALRFDYGAEATASASILWAHNFVHVYEINKNKCYVDGVEVASASASTFSPNVPIYLFGVNNNGTLSPAYHPFEIATAKIYQSGRLVLDLKATTAGFYDNISGEIFTNAGSGSLDYIAEHPNDALCTPLEYIQSATSPTAFDSGVYATRDLFVTSVLYLDPDVAKWQSYLGDRPSSGNDFELSFGTNTVANSRAYHRVNGSTSTTSPSGSTKNYLSSKMLIWQKNKSGQSRLHNFGTTSAYGSANQTASASYKSKDTLGIGALKKVGENISDLPDGSILGFQGRIYSCSLGYERCYAPVLYGGKAGLYDLLTDTFHASETMYDFIAGPIIQ